MAFKVVIPARYGSTRMPAKPLVDIGGRPMIQWVIDLALKSGAEEVIVATDDERIAAVACDPRAPQRSLAVMTRADHLSGTDRIAEVADLRGWDDRTIVVNVQGDEPQLPAALVGQTASLLEAHADADLATLCTPIVSLHEFLDPNVVKVVRAGDVALYFSRAPIPWHRDGASQGLLSQTSVLGAQRHLGIYAYRIEALRRLTAFAPSDLELIEKLEQLRALQGGMRIVVGVAAAPPPVGVDTEGDLQRVRTGLDRDFQPVGPATPVRRSTPTSPSQARRLNPMRILFVCMGNICRSPTAEGVFRRLVDLQAPHLKIEIDSAGTHDYHVGHPPDHRSAAAAARRGIDLSGLRARIVTARDFDHYDLILAMDEANLTELRRRAPESHRAQIRLAMDYVPASAVRAVPDPYYGGTNGFEDVLDLLEQAAQGLLEELLAR